GKTLYVSDAEANIIRAIDLGSLGKVRTLVGGNLFDFGDEDGLGNDVRLQHPLGLARWNDKLLIADTYNHKIKLLDPVARSVKSFAGTGKPGQSDGVVSINLELPAGYHWNPTAPQHYQISVEQGGEALTIDPQSANRSTKGLRLPIRVPFGIKSVGAAEIHVSFTFVYCREDNTG